MSSCPVVLSSCPLLILSSSCPLFVLFRPSSCPRFVLFLSWSSSALLAFLPPVLLSSCPPVLLVLLVLLSSLSSCLPALFCSSALLLWSSSPLLSAVISARPSLPSLQLLDLTLLCRSASAGASAANWTASTRCDSPVSAGSGRCLQEAGGSLIARGVFRTSAQRRTRSRRRRS